jgi:hypothetical protein
VSTVDPLRGSVFPYPPRSLTADYVLWDRTQQRRPLGTIGRPVLDNSRFVLHRLAPTGAGDLSSQRLVWDVEEITF